MDNFTNVKLNYDNKFDTYLKNLSKFEHTLIDSTTGY